ncbi:MAG: hypothetical protein PQJ50_04520 [Spirochaetales bacterium]|nr:hypothetical protein [Spirochaetales bacterium]
MKKRTALFILILLIFPFFPASAQDSRIYAPFVSRLDVEPKGSSVLLTWKDAPQLLNPEYLIYASETPFDEERFIYANQIALVEKGTENFLYSPGDSVPRYFLVLAREDGRIFDLFIPYRNMSMSPVAAEAAPVQEERAARISSLSVFPEERHLLVHALSSDPSRPLILFRSPSPMETRRDLTEATEVRIFESEEITLKDRVVPGIPFYYALVDKALYESGSEIVLYEGSVTLRGVSIPLEQWSSDEAHSFQYASRPVPLPLLSIDTDIETGDRLPDPDIPRRKVDLDPETELALAGLDFGKSVDPAVWKEKELLPVDMAENAPPETSWAVPLMEREEWNVLFDECSSRLKQTFDSEVRSRLFFYRAQASYFTGDLETAFMDFLSARERYYSESNHWLFNIYRQRRMLTVSQDLE